MTLKWFDSYKRSGKNQKTDKLPGNYRQITWPKKIYTSTFTRQLFFYIKVIVRFR